MSTVNKLPIIKKILNLMASGEINFLVSVMNTKDQKVTLPFGHLPQTHDICLAVIQNQKYPSLTGILWNTRDEEGNRINDDYYLIALFNNNQYVDFYHIVQDQYTRIKESITLLEIRHWLLDYTSSKGTVTLLYPDGTLGAPDSAKVDAFVRSQGFEEPDFNRIRVVIESTKVIWSYISLPTPQWIGGGSDVVDPFTNTSQGSIVGVEQDGYVEHLVADPSGAGHVHGWENVKSLAENAMPKSGGNFTGDVNMGSHILNMAGGSIKNVGSGTDDDAFSLGKGKQVFVQKSSAATGETAYTHLAGVETNMVIANSTDGNTLVKRSNDGKIKANAGNDNDDVVNVGQLSSTLTGYLQKNTDTSSYKRIYSVGTDGVNSLLSIDNNFGISNNHNLADIDAIKAFVNSSITASAANYVTSDAVGSNFPTKARLVSGPYFNKGVSYTPQKNDYAIVAQDETHGNNQCRYSYDGTQWAYQYTLNVPFTAAQQAAIDSGITSSLVTTYNNYATNKMNKNDGVGTGTTKLENLLLSGDMTFNSGADVDFTGANVDLDKNTTCVVEETSSEYNVVNRQYIDTKIIRKSGAPTSATVGHLGATYINSDDGKTYKCTKVDTTTTPVSYIWTLQEFVPLTGTDSDKPITGNLLFQVANKAATEPSADIVLGAKHNNMAIKLWGGTNYNTGAFIEAYGSDAQVEWGGSLQQRHGWLVFGVPTLDGSGYTKEAYLKPDGTFTFDGKNIVKVTGAGTYGNLIIASPTSGIPGWSYTNTLSNSIKLNGNEIIESLSGAGFVLTGKSDSSYISLLGGSVDGATINLTGKSHAYKGTLELIGRDGTTNETKMTIGVDKGVHYITRSYINQSRATLFSLSTTMDETLILSSVKFSAEDSPLGSADAQFEVEIHNTGLSIGSYGYILAKNRAGFFISNLDNGTWGDWSKLTFGNFLPLAGAQMTGSITHANDGGISVIKGINNTSNNAIAFGGTSYSGGASIWLAGKDYTGGGFGIDAYDGTTRKSLIGNATTGILSWGTDVVLTGGVKKYLYGIDGGTCIIMKCGKVAVATFNGNFGTTGGEIVLPDELKKFDTGYSINEVTAMISGNYGDGSNMRMVWVDVNKLHVASRTTTGSNYRGSLTWITQN